MILFSSLKRDWYFVHQQFDDKRKYYCTTECESAEGDEQERITLQRREDNEDAQQKVLFGKWEVVW